MALPDAASRLMESAAEAESQGNVREALIRYEAAIKVAPEEPLTHLRLGVLCHRLRDYRRAQQVLARAARLAPEDAEVAFWEGRAQDALGVLRPAVGVVGTGRLPTRSRCR